MKLEFSLRSFEKYSSKNLINIRPVGAEMFQVDGRTDLKKLIVAFRNSVNAPKYTERNPL